MGLFSMRERALVGVTSGAVAKSLTWLDPEWTDMFVEDEVDQLLKRMMLRRSRSVGVHTFLGTWAHNLRKARYWTNQG